MEEAEAVEDPDFTVLRIICSVANQNRLKVLQQKIGDRLGVSIDQNQALNIIIKRYHDYQQLMDKQLESGSLWLDKKGGEA